VAARYAGLIGSMGNIFAYGAGIVMPYATGAMVKYSTVAEWRGTLLLVAGVLAAGGIQYMIFGSAQEQPWARGQKPVHKVFTVKIEDGVKSICDSECKK